MKKMIIPAIIAKKQDELEEKILKVKDFVELIQLDFMDGKFVPNDSINFEFILPETNCKYEAHLMVDDPNSWVEKNHSKVDTILAHFESLDNPKETIEIIKNKNKKTGFVINPETKVDEIEEYLPILDQVLIMTVKPGFYGSKFIPEMKDKIKKLRKIAPEIDIEVDGGISDKTIEIVDKAGANMFVSGSYIVKSDNVKKRVDTLKNLVD